jgi:hypothetical protein
MLETIRAGLWIVERLGWREGRDGSSGGEIPECGCMAVGLSIPLSGERKLATHITRAGADEITVAMRQSYLRSSQSSHLNDDVPQLLNHYLAVLRDQQMRAF